MDNLSQQNPHSLLEIHIRVRVRDCTFIDRSSFESSSIPESLCLAIHGVSSAPYTPPGLQGLDRHPLDCARLLVNCQGTQGPAESVRAFRSTLSC
jgi:hypothetical protein